MTGNVNHLSIWISTTRCVYFCTDYILIRFSPLSHTHWHRKPFDLFTVLPVTVYGIWVWHTCMKFFNAKKGAKLFFIFRRNKYQITIPNNYWIWASISCWVWLWSTKTFCLFVLIWEKQLQKDYNTSLYKNIFENSTWKQI